MESPPLTPQQLQPEKLQPKQLQTDQLQQFLADEVSAHRRTLDSLVQSCGPDFAEMAICWGQCLAGGHTIFLFGNGGSAADAQHIAAEITGRYQVERPGLPAIALTTDTSALTAIGNDYGFERIFSRQLEALARPGDIALGISTSGNSANVVDALKTARDKGITALGLAGGSGGNMVGLADPLIIVPSHVTARIQEMHILIGHTLCGSVEKWLGYA